MPNRILQLFIPFFLLVIVFQGCGRRSDKKKQAQDSSIYSQKNYSEFFIDSNYIDSILLNEKIAEEFKTGVKDFYRRRNYQTAWFSNQQLSENAVNFMYRIDEYKEAFKDSSIINGHDHELITEAILDSTYQFNKRQLIQRLDIKLTIAFYKFATKEYYGISDTVYDLEWFIPRKKKSYALLLEKVTTSAFEFEKFEPVNNYYKSLKKALIAYRKIERSGGLPLIDTLKKKYSFEDSIAFYKNLRNYFLLTQDWMPGVESFDTNDTLKNSIANFQERMGLGVSGMLDEETVDALNTPIKDRIFQMMINLERLRWIPEHIPESYLLVNIPEFKLHVFEQNKINFSMNVVVGKSATVTTIFNGNLSTIVFSPYWNVPQSIIAKELLPKIKKDPNYLKKNNMEVVKNNVVFNSKNINWHLYSQGVPFTIREKPGKHNSLGLIKFLFPNSYSIYMHDTPSKGLFEKRSRDFSHGCIRLSEPLKLATYLLKNDTSITQEKIIKWMNGGAEKYIKVKPAMPVFILYFTSWVNHKGQLNFRKDIYGLDKKLSNEIFALQNK
jgi:hypothetical protein